MHSDSKSSRSLSTLAVVKVLIQKWHGRKWLAKNSASNACVVFKRLSIILGKLQLRLFQHPGMLLWDTFSYHTPAPLRSRADGLDQNCDLSASVFGFQTWDQTWNPLSQLRHFQNWKIIGRRLAQNTCFQVEAQLGVNESEAKKKHETTSPQPFPSREVVLQRVSMVMESRIMLAMRLNVGQVHCLCWVS